MDGSGDGWEWWEGMGGKVDGQWIGELGVSLWNSMCDAVRWGLDDSTPSQTGKHLAKTTYCKPMKWKICLFICPHIFHPSCRFVETHNTETTSTKTSTWNSSKWSISASSRAYLAVSPTPLLLHSWLTPHKLQNKTPKTAYGIHQISQATHWLPIPIIQEPSSKS